MQLTTNRSIRLSADVAACLRQLPTGTRAEYMRTALRALIARHNGRLPAVRHLPRGRAGIEQFLLQLPADLSKAVDQAARSYRLSALVEMALRVAFGLPDLAAGDAK